MDSTVTIKNLVTSEVLLSRLSLPVDLSMPIPDDDIRDLEDVAEYNAENNKMGCIGLAANQINVLKRIIVVRMGVEGVGLIFVPMINPEFEPVLKAGTLGATERCLSRPDMPGIYMKRWKKIIVTWFDPIEREMVTRKFTKLTARVIQHEVDHLNGVLV